MIFKRADQSLIVDEILKKTSSSFQYSDLNKFIDRINKVIKSISKVESIIKDEFGTSVKGLFDIDAYNSSHRPELSITLKVKIPSSIEREKIDDVSEKLGEISGVFPSLHDAQEVMIKTKEL